MLAGRTGARENPRSRHDYPQDPERRALGAKGQPDASCFEPGEVACAPGKVPGGTGGRGRIAAASKVVMNKDVKAEERLDEVIWETTIKSCVSSDIIQEHKERPIGKHSDALERVLLYLRRNRGTMEGKYVIVHLPEKQEWRVSELSGVRGVPPKILPEPLFRSKVEAEHGTFLLRLRKLGLAIGTE